MRFLSIYHPSPPPPPFFSLNRTRTPSRSLSFWNPVTLTSRRWNCRPYSSFLARWMRINRESRLHNNPIKFAMHYQLPTPPHLFPCLCFVELNGVPCLISSPLLRFRCIACIHRLITIYRLKDENGPCSFFLFRWLPSISFYGDWNLIGPFDGSE